MSRIRLLWDRLTGREADRLHARFSALRQSDRDNHLREIEQIRHAALDEGVWLYRHPETTVDVTMFDDSEPQSMVASWVWRATTLHEPDLSGMRKFLSDPEGYL